MHTLKLKTIMGPMRPPFLILTPACVLLGLGTAVWTAGPVGAGSFILALIGAVSAHASVNAFNEYFDFKSGLDLRTQRTPFSGGSGTLPNHPNLARSALAAAVVTFALAALIGIYFLHLRGPGLLPLGLTGLFMLVAYTRWIVCHPLLCLIAPGLGFGPLMVMGTDFVLTGNYSWTSFTASLVPFFLVSNLLLLNQFPDVEADRQVDRRHFPIVSGKRFSSLLYAVFLLLAYLSITVGVFLKILPAISLIGLSTLIIAVPAVIGAWRYAEDIQKLIPYMGLNVIVNVTTPILIAIGLLLRA